jgi:hypothetical protein
MSIVISPDGNVENLTDTKLKTLQEAVGGYIEIIDIGNGEVLIVNEEGNMLGLPPNHVATKMLGKSIVGNVVLTNRSNLD